MNEFLQQSCKEIGVDIDFKAVELETLYTHWRKDAKDDINKASRLTTSPTVAEGQAFHASSARVPGPDDDRQLTCWSPPHLAALLLKKRGLFAGRKRRRSEPHRRAIGARIGSALESAFGVAHDSARVAHRA